MIRYNRCRGRSNPCYFIWYHFRIVICRNFDVRNRNAGMVLENWYDSEKIGMVGISVDVQICLSLLLVAYGIVTKISCAGSF